MSAEDKVHLPDSLVLLMDGRPMGSVSRSKKDGSRLTFDYDDQWRAVRGAMPLSLSMPVSGSAYSHDVINPWMWNLLPDNEVLLQKIATSNRVSAANAFALLWVIGEDCPGAVQFVEPDRLDSMTQDGKIEILTEADVGQRLADLKRTQTLGRKRDEGQFSLPGAQPKTALSFIGGQWGVPSGRIPTTHILKPPIQDLDGHAENEVFCLRLAKKVGLTAAKAKVEWFGDEVAIVVERYDRFLTRNGRLARIHQEDMCQALSVHPSIKYENQGGPGIVKIMELLNWTSEPTADRRSFMNAIAYNFLIMGTDAHAKNYSLLIGANSRVRLAPLYDIASYLPHIEDRWQDILMPMKVDKYYRYSEVVPRHWARMAKACGFPEDEAIDQVATLAATLPAAAHRAATELRADGVDHEVLGRLVDLIARRCDYVINAWDLGPRC
jgi:serine/threonine-protein kinase HipA